MEKGYLLTTQQSSKYEGLQKIKKDLKLRENLSKTNQQNC